MELAFSSPSSLISPATFMFAAEKKRFPLVNAIDVTAVPVAETILWLCVLSDTKSDLQREPR